MSDAETPSETEGVDTVVSTLNQLIQTCKDGQEGFRTAAEAVDDLNLQHLLQSYSQQRGEFAAELDAEVRRLGHDPSQSGHLSASLHRSWMDIKAVVTGRDETAIIAECERGEDAAFKIYQQALSSALPEDLRVLVERQLIKVKEAHDQIRSLEQVHSRHR